ncbi:MAG: hypothetical protein ABI910_22695 [Gemmatimonadota bacterium]
MHFPSDPIQFLARPPHGYHDCAQVQRDLGHAGVSVPRRVDTLAARALAARFGTTALDGLMQAHLVSVERWGR